ncbi:heme ABC exporter ATP-binding protein CcmA [Erythrobacter rubeus]|uniref:Heme ABC exporter ATP-binding protein CcmA n=1 Tax=Erythrobacter rubeus TaxID=2760803 RepID=A0ABR8KPC8_9SPHN|nr:heme ABC exporter ATP-binding protein CcmA [Erythrobacter rubeus]MBD2842514.1 heme ABC exporter ATP-binding protein CcmA [Erythrobacter rubeus]
MQGSAAPSLSARDLACRRGDRVLFRGLSFELGPGAAMHVTGANGTGKTTLIRALAGLKTPFIGQVLSSGAIGLLDERTGLDPDQPLGRALQFWQSVDGCGDPAETVTLLVLGPLLDVPVRYLSTGQRKRAGLAALLGRNVPIWLLDEPLSGLDARAMEQVTALISEHVTGGGIALIASHQPLAIEGLTTLAIEDYAPAAERLP